MQWEILGHCQILIIIIQMMVFIGTKPIQDDLINSVGEMAHNIIYKYFSDSGCIGTITEISSEILNYIPKSLYMFHIHIGGNDTLMQDLEESDTLDFMSLNNATMKFENLLIAPLNAGCLGFLIQVSKPKAVIHCFARASRRAMFRANRKYLYLPVLKEGVAVSMAEDEIFLMKEMDYMPDLVVTKIVQNKVKEKSFNVPNGVNSKSVNSHNDQCCKKIILDYERDANSYNHDCLKEYNMKETILRNHTSEIKFKIELRTHKFIGTNRSENVLLDVWISGNVDCRGKFAFSMDLFPDKTRDVKGKQLTIVTWYYPPFITLDLNSQPPLYDGIEFRVAREFLNYINASFRVTMDPQNYWGEAFDNGTGNGVLGLMSMDQGDIGFSAFYAWPNSFKVVDFPSSHMRSSVTMVTPRPKRKPGWMVPLMPFSSAMWGSVGACLVGATFSLYTIQNIVDRKVGGSLERPVPYSQLDYTALCTYGMLVNQSPVFKLVSTIPRHVPARHFVAWFLFMAEIICDTYNAGLASVLSTPRFEPPIETVEDLALRNIIWGGNHVAWIWSIEEDDSPILRTITKNFRIMTEEQMYEIGHKSGDMAFGIERLQGGHFTTESHIKEETITHRRVMKGTLYWSHLYFLLRKGSPYMHHFDILVTRVREAGLPLYWEGEVIRRYMSERLQLQIITSRILHDTDGPTKLNLNQLQGAFLLLVLGDTLALIIFIIELFSSREKKIDNLFKNNFCQKK